MTKMLKRKYTPQSPYIRAALDYLDVNQTAYYDFGSFADKRANVKHWPGCKEAALAMFEQGHVDEAWLHTNQHVAGREAHEFWIAFKKRESGLCPRLSVVIEVKQEAEWTREAASYRKALSLKNGLHKPTKSGRKPPL